MKTEKVEEVAKEQVVELEDEAQRLAPQPPQPFVGACGLVVDNEVRFHQSSRILVFDDSKIHSAFNHSPACSRTVLIFDIARPEGLPLGTAVGSTTVKVVSYASAVVPSNSTPVFVRMF